VNSALPLVTVAAASSPTQNIHVPVLVPIGQLDQIACGGPDGMTCTTASILSLEQPYYTHATSLTTQVVSTSGHSLSQHPTAPTAHSGIINWIHGIVLP
jgi:hypothetical protein